jgi:hypothetical protein
LASIAAWPVGALPVSKSKRLVGCNHGRPCAALCRGGRCVGLPLFAKLLYNCTLNPLAAIMSVNYGQLASNPATRRLIDQLMAETFAIVQAMVGYVERQGRVHGVATPTNSMLADLVRFRQDCTAMAGARGD